MALSWLPKQDPGFLSACAASGEALCSFNSALYVADIAGIAGEDLDPDWYLQVMSTIDMPCRELVYCYRNTATITPRPEVRSLYGSLTRGGDQVDSIYLQTTRLEQRKSSGPSIAASTNVLVSSRDILRIRGTSVSTSRIQRLGISNRLPPEL